jgi:hypothetical protein
MGFETMISAGERPQTYALDRAATGTGNRMGIRYDNRQDNKQDNTEDDSQGNKLDNLQDSNLQQTAATTLSHCHHCLLKPPN